MLSTLRTILVISLFFFSFNSFALEFNVPTERDLFESGEYKEIKAARSNDALFEENLVYQGSMLWSGTLLTHKAGNYIYAIYKNGLKLFEIKGADIYEKDSIDLEIGPYSFYLRTGIDINNDMALIMLGSNLHLVDVSNVNDIKLLSSLSLNAGSVEMIRKGDHAYVSYRDGFQIVKIAGLSLQFIKNIETEEVWHGSVGIRGDLFYLGGYGLYVFDITDPESPVEKTFIADPWGETQISYYYFHMENDLMVIPQHYIQYPEDPPIVRISISEFDAEGLPKEVFNESFTGIGEEVDIDGDKLFVNDPSCGVRIFDISTHSSPTPLAVYAPSVFPRKISIENGYMSYFTEQLQPPSNYCQTWIAAVDRVVSSAPAMKGIYYEDLREISNPQTVATFKNPPSISGIDISGNYAFAYGEGDINVIDVSDNTNPKLISHIATPGNARRSKMEGNRLYVADEEAGLSIYDMSDPTNPQYLVSCPVGDKALDIEISQTNLFVADGSEGLKVISVDESNMCEVIGTYTCTQTCSYASDLSLLGRSSLLMAGGDWMNLLYVSDPTNPVYQNRVRANGHTTGVPFGEFVGIDVVAAHTMGSRIYRFAGDFPDELSTLPAVRWLTDVMVDRYTFYMVDYEDAVIYVYDLSNAADPFLLGEIDTPGRPREVAKNENIFMVADSSNLAYYRTDIATDVGDDDPSQLPKHFTLEQNYPNPFNPSTTIEFSLARKADVKLEVYNTLGQLVKTLLNSTKRAGKHFVTWDGTNSNGKKVTSGVYFYKLIAGDERKSRKMLLLK